MNDYRIKPLHIALLLGFFLTLIWSFINPHDIFTWMLEVLPALLGLVVVIFTYNRFRLSDFAYVLITLEAVVLMVGGHYTYAQVPLFNWLRDSLDLARNHYDRLGHFAQGLVPAIIAREIMLRTTPLKWGRMMYFLVVSVCMAVSACYELVEWGVAEATGSAASAFLGTQGDVWDTQWDMFMALLGANFGLLFMRVLHDRSMEKGGLIK